MFSLSCLCFCFFFLKQRTAYEMRISDWSSDVCSSDLRWREAFFGPADPGLDALAEIDARRARASQRLMMGRSALVNLPMLGAVQIGRASCRERVCPYVSISVGAVSLKKKSNAEERR